MSVEAKSFPNLVGAKRLLYSGALLLWTFAGLDGALSRDLNGDVFTLCAKFGGALLACALIVDLLQRLLERGSLERMFEAKKVTRGELGEAREFSKNFVPEVPSLEQLSRIFEASRGCVWFVNRCESLLGSKKSERVGFFSLIRLTEAAIPLYASNNLNSFQMDRTHIAGPKNRATGLYVGGVGAKGLRAKGWVVQYLRSRIDTFFESGGCVVFTRPVTEDGLRMAKSLGFRPAVPEQFGLGNIYRLDQ